MRAGSLRGTLLLTAALCAGLPCSGAAQGTLERSPNLDAGWIGLPWILELDLLDRFSDEDRGGFDVVSLPTFSLALGLPHDLLAGLRFAAQSPVPRDGGTEIEAFGRFAPWLEDAGDPLTLALQAGINAGTGSLDGEVSLARWLGPARLLGAARAFSDAYDEGDARAALAAGAVLHPFPGRIPVALAADVASLLDRDEGEEWAWSIGVQVGVSFTPNTVSLHLTNAGSGTLEGRTRGGDDVRLGLEITVPIPAGAFLGSFAPREAATAAVAAAPPGPPAVRVPIRRYAYLPARLEIDAGTTVEWVNEDAVVHTATADDASWNSGAIPPGRSWRATFSRPGIYPYHCGPHPFMKAAVVVR